MPIRKQGTLVRRCIATAIAGSCLFAPVSASARISDSRHVTRNDIRDEVSERAPGSSRIVDDAKNAVRPDHAEKLECPDATTEKAFADYGDYADYFVAPGGDFEYRSEQWDFDKGASETSGNENAGVLRGSRSLTVKSGGVAISPEFCANEDMPTFRFVMRPNQMLSSYEALILYRDAAGTLTKAKFIAATGFFRMPGVWAPSPISPLATMIPLIEGGATASVQVVLRASSGSMSFDSVMIDPYRRG